MDIRTELKENCLKGGTVLTMGAFDGLHLAHARIIQRTVETAKSMGLLSVLVTFDPHPQHVLRSPDSPAKAILTAMPMKKDLLKSFGLDTFILLPFTKETAEISAKKYLETLVKCLQPKKIVLGFDHQWGKNREGNAEFLQKNEAKYGFRTEVIQEMTLDGQVVRSSTIRQCLTAGDLALANKLLGRRFSMQGHICKGDGRGSDLGFPTANLCLDNALQLIPKTGVYSVDVLSGGNEFSGICNIGTRPTFGQGSISIESHLFSEEPVNLYGEKAEFLFNSYIRPEKKFENASELMKQIENDIENVRNVKEE